MLNKTISEFKRNHINKKNQILFHTINSNGIKETENLINNFLIEKNSFIFESVENLLLSLIDFIDRFSKDFVFEKFFRSSYFRFLFCISSKSFLLYSNLN